MIIGIYEHNSLIHQSHYTAVLTSTSFSDLGWFQFALLGLESCICQMHNAQLGILMERNVFLMNLCLLFTLPDLSVTIAFQSPSQTFHLPLPYSVTFPEHSKNIGTIAMSLNYLSVNILLTK